MMKSNMFSRVLVLVLALLMLCSLAGCIQEPQAAVIATVPPTEAPTPPPTEPPVPEGIPVYDQEKLLAATDLFALNRHNSYYSSSESGPVFLEKLLSASPSDAICVQPDGRIYICWDTQLGIRLYLFLEEQDQNAAVTGYPILVCKDLSHDDFKGLEKGRSTLADVAKIEFHDDYMMENAFGAEQSYKLDDRDLPWYEGSK